MKTAEFFDKLYVTERPKRYPNEELVRFIDRHYANAPTSTLWALDVGCGSGNNLKMLKKENFQAIGIDSSDVAVQLSHSFGLAIKMSMTEMDFEDNRFDLVCDVFSSYCLTSDDFEKYLTEVYRVLKPGGKLLFYNPTKTMGEMCRRTNYAYMDFGPYHDHDTSFSFINSNYFHYSKQFKILRNEIISYTYDSRENIFSFAVMDLEKL